MLCQLWVDIHAADRILCEARSIMLSGSMTMVVIVAAVPMTTVLMAMLHVCHNPFHDLITGTRRSISDAASLAERRVAVQPGCQAVTGFTVKPAS